MWKVRGGWNNLSGSSWLCTIRVKKNYDATAKHFWGSYSPDLVMNIIIAGILLTLLSWKVSLFILNKMISFFFFVLLGRRFEVTCDKTANLMNSQALAGLGLPHRIVVYK